MTAAIGRPSSSENQSGGATPLIGVNTGSSLFRARLPGFPASSLRAVGLGRRPERPAVPAISDTPG